MNPEERQLLERSLKLAEENNKMLIDIQARARRAAIYGFIKLALYVVPFVIGYLYLEPFIKQATGSLGGVSGVLNTYQDLLK